MLFETDEMLKRMEEESMFEDDYEPEWKIVSVNSYEIKNKMVVLLEDLELFFLLCPESMKDSFTDWFWTNINLITK